MQNKQESMGESITESITEISRICPGVYRFEDDTQSTFYLILGRSKALAIDTGTGHAPVLPAMRALTDLPIELAVTHAHGDHFGSAYEFDTVYMHPADIALLPEMQERFRAMMGVRPVRPATLRPRSGGETLDLGGVEVLALEIGGHTPGSLAFIDLTHRCVFTGDAIGSGVGVWMQVFHALPIAAYRANLAGFRAAAEAYAGFDFQGGHYTQAGQSGSDAYNPPSMAMVDDMIALCDRILAGTAEYSESKEVSFTPEPARIARHGRAKIVYMQSNLR